MILTLGLMLPWREAALERYKMRHSYYGDLPGDFVGRGSDFFKQGWWLWLSPIVVFVVLLVPDIVGLFFPKIAPVLKVRPKLTPVASFIFVSMTPFL